MEKYFTPCQLEKLEKAEIGLAGLGGLGSNIAVLLARSGIGKFILVDCDLVDWSNLNRQVYFPRHVGRRKTESLKEIILELNKNAQITCNEINLSVNNIQGILNHCGIWIEALDDAKSKAIFVNEACKNAEIVISASGICGIGGEPLTKRKLGNLYIIGDNVSAMECFHPYAPRVTQAAAMMADCVLEYVLSERPGKNSQFNKSGIS